MNRWALAHAGARWNIVVLAQIPMGPELYVLWSKS